MRNSKILRKVLMAAACIALAAAGLYHAQQARAAATYTIIASVSEGFSYGASGNLMKDVGKSVSAKTGLTVNVVEHKLSRGEDMYASMLALFKAKKADFTFFYSQDFVRFPEVKSAVDPIFTITMNNKPYTYSCAYVRAADNIKSIQQLKGKKWAMSSLIATYWLLQKNGIKEEPKKFFSGMSFMEDAPAGKLLDALLGKKIDVFISPNMSFDMAISGDSKYSKNVKAVGCVEFDHNMIFVARKGLPAADVAKVKAAFLGAHKDKAFQSFWFIFKAINGHFVEFDPKNLGNTQQIVEAGKKGGWYAKEKEFIKKKGM